MNLINNYFGISIVVMFLYMFMCFFPTIYFLVKMIYSPYKSKGGEIYENRGTINKN